METIVGLCRLQVEEFPLLANITNKGKEEKQQVINYIKKKQVKPVR